MSISPLGTHGGNRSNCKANLCCCPGRTGQWPYPDFRGKSNTKRRKLFSQDHLSGVDSVLCSPCFLSTGIELQVSQRALNLLVSFLKMLTWKGHGLKAYQKIPVDFFHGLFTATPTHLGCVQTSSDLQGCEVGVWEGTRLEADCLHLLLLPERRVWSSNQPGSPCGTPNRYSPLQIGVVYPLHSASWDRWNVAQLMGLAEWKSHAFHFRKKSTLNSLEKAFCIYEPAYRFRKCQCRDVHGSLQLLPAFLGFQLRVLGILLLLGSPLWTPQHPDTGRQQVPNPPTEATFWHVA